MCYVRVCSDVYITLLKTRKEKRNISLAVVRRCMSTKESHKKYNYSYDQCMISTNVHKNKLSSLLDSLGLRHHRVTDMKEEKRSKIRRDK